jgi:hypothetical protein
LLLVLALALLASPDARGAMKTFGGDPVTVDVADYGALQFTTDDKRFFYGGSPGLAGFVLSFEDGPLAGRAFSSYGYGGDSFTPVSQGEPALEGDTWIQETVYAVRHEDADVVRVHQTTRQRTGELGVRITYEVENRRAEPIRFRAATAADLTVEGNSYGTGTLRTRAPRFVGGVNSATEIEGGIEEVRQSRLPDEAAARAVPAWSGYYSGGYSSALQMPMLAPGLDDTVVSYEMENGVAVEWEDHLGAGDGLAPGRAQAARYEVLWRVRREPPFRLQAERTDRYTGMTHTVSARVNDADGRPLADRLVRWKVTGPNGSATERSAPTSATGIAELSYAGTAAGDDVLTAYADLDGDGARDAGEAERSHSVRWSEPPPRLRVSRWPDSPQVGSPMSVDAELRKPDGDPLPDGVLRWSVSGANPTDGWNLATTNSWATAWFTLTARHAGTDTLTVFGDYDADGTRDADEPMETRTYVWEPPPPPVVVECHACEDRPAGDRVWIGARLRNEFGELISGPLRWSVSGVTDVPETTARTDEYGWVELSYVGARSGEDTVTVYADVDGDERRDEGEYHATQTVRWRQAPPPPVTHQTIDGSPLDVTVSSAGSVRTGFDDPADPGGVLYDNGTSGFVLRFTHGALAGRTFGTMMGEPFHSDPQSAPVRNGATVTQATTFRVRWDDVDYARVHQTTRYTDGESRVRVTYRVESLTDEPLAFRAATFGGVSLNGSSWGPNLRLDSPRRFLGATDPASGISAGVEEVAVSNLASDAAPVPVPAWSGSSLGSFWELSDRFRSPAGVGSHVEPEGSRVVAVEWGDHASLDDALTAGLDAASRYEVVWRLRKPPALHLTPPTTVAETRHTHRVTATLLDLEEQPLNDVALRWKITGAHPGEGVATSAGLGQAVIAWEGSKVGRDTITVYADHDGDGERDADEPERTASVDWRAETAVDPPVIDPVVAPDGTRWQIGFQTQGDQRFFQVPAGAPWHFPTCADGSPQMNLHLRINVFAGAGQVVPGSMTLRTVANGSVDPSQPIDSIPPLGDAVEDNYEFVLECVRQTALYLCYTLEEPGLLPESFCVLLGGLGLWDPQGVVYDSQIYDTHIARGLTPDAARAKAALPGATVRLQRRYEGAYRPVLSGDPFVTPNLNPQVTRGDGRFEWAVSPGTYRVVVSRAGYTTTTSRAVTVPPAELALHVAVKRLADVEPPPGLDPGPAPEATPSPTPTATPEPSPTPSTEPASSEPAPPPGRLPPPPGAPDAPPPRSAPPAPLQDQSPFPARVPEPAGATPSLAGSSLDRRGRLVVRLRCPVASAGCKGSMKLLTRRERRRIAVVAYRLGAGAERRYRVRLSRTSRAALRERGRRRVRVLAQHAGATATTFVVRIASPRE